MLHLRLPHVVIFSLPIIVVVVPQDNLVACLEVVHRVAYPAACLAEPPLDPLLVAAFLADRQLVLLEEGSLMVLLVGTQEAFPAVAHQAAFLEVLRLEDTLVEHHQGDPFRHLEIPVAYPAVALPCPSLEAFPLAAVHEVPLHQMVASLEACPSEAGYWEEACP